MTAHTAPRTIATPRGTLLLDAAVSAPAAAALLVGAPFLDGTLGMPT